MISFDLECGNEHRFEGIFRDYDSFIDQMARGMVTCPFCDSGDVRRLFRGCSIHARPSTVTVIDRKTPNLFEVMRQIESHVRENFDNVGNDFAETARAIYYGIEEERNIYGQSTQEEIKELIEEGIRVLPLPPAGTLEN